MQKNIHQEFAYQSRELGAQIEDTLGDPPDRKNYALVIKSLLGEYAKGTQIDDVNLLSFALADHLRFDGTAGLLAECKHYDTGDTAKVMSMVSCADGEASKALATVFGNNPELARKAVITAFLFKNSKRWADADDLPEAEEEENQNFDDGDEDDERGVPGQDVIDCLIRAETGMTDNSNFPAISRQVTELVLAGSSEHAEEAINDTAEQFGDLAVVAVLDTLEPQVAAMHLSAFDGGKLSLATLLISPKAWAESLAFFAATWSEAMIGEEPEKLTESLFAHIHGVVFSSDDTERRTQLIHEALATDWGTTAFAVLFSTAIGEIIELANDIHTRGAHSSGQTTGDHDVIPLALEIARSDADAWDRVLFELFPDWVPDENQLRARSEEDEEDDDDAHHHEYAYARTTHDLLLRLRKQVPSKSARVPKAGARPSLGEDIFA